MKTPLLSEPSHASKTITQLADLISYASPHSLIGEHGLGQLLSAAQLSVANLNGLPAATADEVARKTAQLLPPLKPGITCGEYTALLRTLAEVAR